MRDFFNAFRHGRLKLDNNFGITGKIENNICVRFHNPSAYHSKSYPVFFRNNTNIAIISEFTVIQSPTENIQPGFIS